MNLKTYEYLFLYAINPKTNKIYFSVRASIDYGLAGALIYELIKEGIVVIDENKLEIKDSEIEDDTLQLTIAAIKKIDKKSVRKNTSGIANKINKIRESIILSLVRKKILELNEGQILGVFQNNTYIVKNESLLSSHTQKLKSTFLNEINATNNEVMLLNLIEACALTKKVFPDKQERKKFKNWLKSKN